MKIKEKKRWIKEIDLIKALAIVLIVVSHLHNFVNLGYYDTLLESASIFLASIGLSLFFFISGFSLYYNHDLIPINKVTNFYRKRAVRIYPLFWLAIIFVAVWCFYYYGFLMVWGAKVNFEYFLIAFLGLQGIFYTETPSVLYWFVGVILIYYFIYPFLISSKNIKKVLLISLVTYGIFLFIRLKLNLIIPNFFIYYWTFVFGIVLCWFTHKNTDFTKKIAKYNQKYKNIALILLFLIFVILYDLTKNINSIYLKYIFLSFLLLLPILSIYYASLIYKDLFNGKIYSLISKISFSTYATFLFFGPILFMIVILMQKINLNTYYINFVVVVFGVPLVFIIGYYIQKLELKLNKKLR